MLKFHLALRFGFLCQQTVQDHIRVLHDLADTSRRSFRVGEGLEDVRHEGDTVENLGQVGDGSHGVAGGDAAAGLYCLTADQNHCNDTEI